MESAGSSVWNRSEVSLETALPDLTSQAASAPLTTSPSRSASLLFVDSKVSDYQSLIAGTQAEVHILDSTDAIAQITQTLTGRSNISSLQILSHGAAGRLALGGDWVNLGDLDRYANQLQSWASALTEDADILLYGCDVARGEIGQTFVQQLAKLTGAEVAASDDVTGNSALGGDWDLEVKTGDIETPLAFDPQALARYDHTLANVGDVIINEFSQGSGGGKEWVEILVVTDNLNLQNHRLLDGNNSLNIQLTGTGFASLKSGTLIVLYNGGDQDGTITPDLAYNPTAGDYSLQVSSLNATGNFAITRTLGWSGLSGEFGNASQTDLPQLINTSGTQIYVLPRQSSDGGKFTAYQSNGAAGATNANNWSPDTVSTSATPGLPNGGSNTTWINSLRGNVAPVLDTTGNPTLPTIRQGVSNPIGTRVADLIASLGGTGITDADFGALKGIAITGADNTNGTWQFSTNGGTNWTNLGTVSDNAATLLGATPLYAPELGNAINTQSWLSYNNLRFVSGIALAGTSTQFPGTNGTLLNTTADIRNYAGYTNYQINPDFSQSFKNPAFPSLDRASGYDLSFNLQVLQETHTNNDRGFAVILLGQDNQGIELGFQFDGTNGRIFAQNLDAQNQFVGAESISFNTNALTAYRLAIQGDTYQLFANGTQILTGTLRDYRNWTSPDGSPSPYALPNFVFLGDNTTSAQGIFNVGQIALQTDTRIRFVPNATYAGNAQISVRAWDGADGGSNGQASVNVTNNGGTTAFSTAVETVTIAVTPLPTLGINRVTQNEGNSGTTAYTFTVTLSQAVNDTVTVNYTTVDATATVANSDYVAASGQLTFAPNQTTQTITLLANGDTQPENNESFGVRLSNANNATISGTGIGLGILVNDDATSAWQVVSNADFDRDGSIDLLWRNAITGQNSIWKMNGTSFASSIDLPTVTGGWKVMGLADFDKDGFTDILWRDPNTGGNGIWKMNGTSFASSIALATVTGGWSVAGLADFDKDGFTDILWRDPNTGGNGIWKMNGTSFASSIALATVTGGWSIAGLADFDKDGFTDILWRDSNTGANSVWKMNNTSFGSSITLPSILGSNWRIAGVADFDRDGSIDILWYDAQDGFTNVWKINSTSFESSFSLPTVGGANWEVVGLQDYDKDGKVDILWRADNTNSTTIWKLDGLNFSSSTDLPLVL
ncbi:DUF4347 domain-containing protein [Phormidesmis sp. 146-35]